MRTISAKLTIVLVSTIGALVVTDLVLRRIDDRREAWSRRVTAAWDNAGIPVFHTPFDLATPYQRGLYSGVLYDSNSFGIRGPERSVAKPPDVFRTLLLGDSFAMGSGILYEDTYAARLERRMPAVNGRAHEVLDLGISGMNLESILIRYRQLGLKFDPDLVIYAFVLNDLEGPLYVRTMTCNERHEGHRQSWSHLWRRVGELRASLVDDLFSPPDSYPAELDVNYFDNVAAWNAFESQLDELADIGRTRGVCTVVFIQPQLEMLNRFHPYLRHYDAVATAAAARGLFVVRSFPFFEGRLAGPLWVTWADSHPNAKGHEILADALLDGLKRLPETCWQGDHHPVRP